MAEVQIILDPKYERLPEWQLKLAIRHATNHVEKWLELSPDDSKYAKAVAREAEAYLDEGIRESLTPHMMAKNPITKQKNRTTPIVPDAFELSPFFAQNGEFFRDYVRDPEKIQKYYRTLKASVNTLADVYLAAAMELKKEDFAFPKNASKDTIQQVVLDRYKRVFLVTAILAMIEEVFRADPKAMDDFIEGKLRPLQGAFMKNEFRETFIRSVRDQVLKEGFNKSSLEKIL